VSLQMEVLLSGKKHHLISGKWLNRDGRCSRILVS